MQTRTNKDKANTHGKLFICNYKDRAAPEDFLDLGSPTLRAFPTGPVTLHRDLLLVGTKASPLDSAQTIGRRKLVI